MNKLTYNKLCKVAKTRSILDDPDVAAAMNDLFTAGYKGDRHNELMSAIDDLGIRGKLDIQEADSKLESDVAGMGMLTSFLEEYPDKNNKKIMLHRIREIRESNSDREDLAADVLKERSTKGRSKGTLGSYALAALLGGGMGGYITSNGPRRDQAAAAGIGALGGLLFNYLRRKTYYGKNISV